jgi:hypothetical protein
MAIILRSLFWAREMEVRQQRMRAAGKVCRSCLIREPFIGAPIVLDERAVGRMNMKPKSEIPNPKPKTFFLAT